MRGERPGDLAAKIVELARRPRAPGGMGAFGRKRVENELEWRYEVPKLLAAYRSLWPRASRAVPRTGSAAS